MRHEPILFAAVALFTGYYGYSALTADKGPSTRVRGKQLDYEALGIPDVDDARAPADRVAEFGRDLFTPPRDTQPLPPLEVVPPPLEPLGALWPPTAWGPVPRLHSRFLRAAPAASDDAPADLFEAPPEGDFADVSVELDPDDPAQRAARIAGFKRQYDWLDTGQLRFGQIRGEDRFRLAERPLEAIAFYEVDPDTGQSVFGGQLVTYERERVQDFGFARTPANELELGRVRFEASLTPTDFERALEFADRCVELRNEAARGLELAEEMYGLAQAINVQEDPRPRLGLARCYELGFRFEDAYRTYEALLADGHDTNARVHARLADLLARFRMDERAETRFRRALELARSDWEARWRYGRFLLDRGRADEALEHLAAAVESEPRGDADVNWRVRIRADHAGALLATGQPQPALDRFLRTLSADLEDRTGRAQVAVAGMASAALLLEQPGGSSGVTGTGAGQGGAAPDAGFELLLAGGLTLMRQGDWEGAASALLLARQADPFRAYRASGALSFLAERVGQPEAAYTFIEEALDAAPTDPWLLYQRGRLLDDRGDVSGARASFRAALDRELDYVPALEEMGDLLVELGEYEAAERYFERAVQLEPERGVTWARRGFNQVRLGELASAAECFDRARLETPGLASAALGQAWWSYATGDSQEAETLYGQIVDDRRNASADDRIRAYAEAQGNRIRDHESKEIWRDRFDRQPGRIANDWRQEEGFGPVSSLREGRVFIEGQHDRSGRTRVFRQLPPERFLSFTCDVAVGPSTQGSVGVFVSNERTGRGGVSEVVAEIVIGRHRDGRLQALVRKSSNDEATWYDLAAGPEWPTGEPVQIGIEKVEQGDVATLTLYVDGEPVASGIAADALARARQAISFGVFVEADPGRRVDVSFDNVEVVRRIR